MLAPINRRTFLGSAAASNLVLNPLLRATDDPSPGERIVVGIVGTGGRGTHLASLLAKQPGVSVDFVCDADLKRADKAAGEVVKAGGKSPKSVQDFRKILDDKSIDALVIATANHWHAPAAILACAAGKHVYVEKPCSHNPREGELMVQAARKHKRLVQMGNQRRSWTGVIEACKLVRDGALGRAYLAQSWYTADRTSIGTGKLIDPPAGLDYDLWQGPAPRRPFKDNYLHYTWHWFWHWGNGELGNNGIHMIDLCRWGLGVDYPSRVTSSGGRYRFQDDQETPDTHSVHFEFADRKKITWEGLSCNQLPNGPPAEVIFTGETGSLAIRGGGYAIYDVKGKQVRKESGPEGELTHIANFLSAVRGGGNLNSEIEEGHKSTLLCHLGNIAHRTGRALACSPTDGRILGDKQAMALWRREYEKGWEPMV